MARIRSKIHWLVPGIVISALAGCATTPAPTALLDRAQAQIRAARDAGAANSAPDVLAEAQRRLAAAQDLTANGKNDEAADRAIEAEAAAETARTRARAADLEAQIQARSDENARLQAELAEHQAEASAARSAVNAASTGQNSEMLPPIQLGNGQQGTGQNGNGEMGNTPPAAGTQQNGAVPPAPQPVPASSASSGNDDDQDQYPYPGGY